MSKISVIIPVYNSEKYISETLDSLIKQTFTDWNAICVDDGSTDSSLKILKQYAKKDKRIQILTQKNLGVIVARNNAIKQSDSEYIYTLDIDDVIAPDCLEKLYSAMIAGRGDVITCRVKFFGGRSEEMKLEKPNKLNMALNNCLVNAALFKKSDFEKSGGYDEKYDKGLEDYDLWLNFVYKLNKKIYRVPEVLFFYRIKEKSESRNASSASEHGKIIDTLYAKYAKMRFYKKLYKLENKIIRFIFRIQKKRVMIFKIPVYRFSKYDTVFSVGAACFVPEVLKILKLRDFSGPFDWMWGSDAVSRLKIVKNRFRNYFNKQDFEYYAENPDNGKAVYKNKRTGIVYNHDFPHGDFDKVYPLVAEKYERRIWRTLEHLDKDKRLLMVYAELKNTGNKDDIIKIMDEINREFGTKHIDLLYVNNNPDMKTGKYTKPKRISEYVIYSEYHYMKYPDEVQAAQDVLGKILKRVVK